MSSYDDSALVPSGIGLPVFGSVEDGLALDVMRVEKRHGEWVFDQEIRTQYFVQAKAFPLSDHETARWLRFAVRVAAKGPIVASDVLVLAAYPISRRWHAAVTFKPGNRKGDQADRARESHPSASAPPFESEQAMHRWIEALPHDLWEKGAYLTAGISRPGVEVKARNVAMGRKTFGTLRGSVDCVVEELFGHARLAELRRIAAQGTLACAPINGVKRGLDPDVSLNSSVVGSIDALLGEAILRALAGPRTSDSTQWLGRPVWKLADRIFRDLVYAENRREESISDREQSNDGLEDFGDEDGCD